MFTPVFNKGNVGWSNSGSLHSPIVSFEGFGGRGATEVTDMEIIENQVGLVGVPVGKAGPIPVKNSKLKIKNYFIPLATTEGALVASVNRGCKAISQGGGVVVEVEDMGMTRAPVFKVGGIEEGKKVVDWVKQEFDQLKRVIEATSHHLKLLDIKPWLVGWNLWLRFRFNTGEAMGMNMVTLAVDQAVKLIEEKLKIKCVALSGNMCVDKKPNWLNIIEGRGKRVWVEARLGRKTVTQVLKTTPEAMVEVNYRKNLLGSVMSGSLGFNAHIANVTAAMFIACGQDVAHVVEVTGITTMELEGRDLYTSVYLPELPVGVMGGGTRLPDQNKYLKWLGSDVATVVGVMGAAVLAGEVSLIASLAEGSLASAHERLGRKQ